jgi:hypothetical protein
MFIDHSEGYWHPLAKVPVGFSYDYSKPINQIGSEVPRLDGFRGKLSDRRNKPDLPDIGVVRIGVVVY